MKSITVTKGDFYITSDQKKFDFDKIFDFISNRTYWAKNAPFETVKKSVINSLSFGVFHKNKQIGFWRIISDYSTIAYLGDVFIEEEYRGQGLSKWLMDVIVAHPELQGLRRWILLTADAHKLYEKYGFKTIPKPEVYMERYDPDIYIKSR